MSVRIPTNTGLEKLWLALVMVLTLVGFGLWAAWARLDSGVLAPGEVVPAGQISLVQHAEGGRIASLTVREGDRVKKGDTLMQMDGRDLQLMLNGADAELGSTRKMLHIAKQELDNWGLRERALDRLKANAQIEVDKNKELLKQAFISDLRLMEIENRRLQIEVQIAESRTELEKLRQKIEGLEQNLLETQNKKMRLGQQIDNTRVAAPVAGVVSNLRFAMPGAVVPPGGVIMDLVPEDDTLVVQAKVAPDDIDVVHAGLQARVRLTAYKARNHQTLLGTVTNVSASTIKGGDQNEAVHYKVTVEMADQKQLKSGMQAQVTIITGERLAYRYMLDPILDSMANAFREE